MGAPIPCYLSICSRWFQSETSPIRAEIGLAAANAWRTGLEPALSDVKDRLVGVPIRPIFPGENVPCLASSPVLRFDVTRYSTTMEDVG